MYAIGGRLNADGPDTASIEVLDEQNGWQVLPYTLVKSVSFFALIPLPVS